MATENKRKKLRYMSKAELIAYANSCPKVEVSDKMTVKQIMSTIPEKFRDPEPKRKTVKKTMNVIHEPIKKATKLIPIKEAVRIKANSKLRKYISMDGRYRYGLTEEQIKLANEQIKRAGCTRPVCED